MIQRAVFWPHPPLLLSEYASTADPAAPVRESALALLDGLRSGISLVVLTDAPDPAPTRRAPLGERVARELLQRIDRRPDAVIAVAEDADPTAVAVAAERVRTATAAEPSWLLVLGDGSGRRGIRAPGHLDERALDLDAAVAQALASGDPAGLRALDPGLCAELLVAGRAPWQVAGSVLGEQCWVAADAEFCDPYWVGYHLARWMCVD